MSSLLPIESAGRAENDDPMVSGQEDEGEGDVLMGGNSDDSSEEEEEDEEEERRIREGFIVDEDDEEDDEDAAEERRRIKRRKRRHRKRREEENLEEDDLDLLEENTGASFKKHRRIRRGGDRDSPGATSRRRITDSDEDDLDNDDLDLPKVQDIQRIFDDEGLGADGYDDDMDSFIESDEEDGGALDEEAREEKRRERRRLDKQRQRANMDPEQKEFDAGAWDEIHDVFGTGHEYDWALSGEEEDAPEEKEKPDMRVQDVFEPSVIREKMMTDDDDLIRAQDVPERLQLLNCSFSQNAVINHLERLTEDDVEDAASWITERIAARRNSEFSSELHSAISFAVKCIFIMDYEVPYVWTHKRDDIGGNDLLPLPDLWRVYTLGQKYRSLASRRKSLMASYARLGVEDEYFEKEVQGHIDSVEVVADGVEWLQMKYRGKKQDDFEFQFHDDEQGEVAKKHKMPSRVSAYEFAKKSPAAKLALGFGIQPHHIVHNFMTSNMVHFVEDQDLSPSIYAEQFCFSGAQSSSPEELLRQARLIISTELGKDPLLRREIRKLFQQEALVTVLPTEKGISKIDETHFYNNFKYLKNKPTALMLESAQFLRILEAESESLVMPSIHLPQDVRDDFERRLTDAFRSDNFSDTAKMWNEERSRAICEAIDQHLLPVGAKWMREYVREECEDFIAERCSNQLRSRIDCAPFVAPHMSYGETPSVLAISWGKGDPKRDVISLVYLDEEGRLRDHTKLDNLVDSDFQDEFKDLLRRRRPDVIAIGGFSMATAKLSQRVKELIRPKIDEDTHSGTNDQAFDIPVVYMHDAVARLYRISKRAEAEFPSLSSTAKYCVGLARYAQNPLNEYASMGHDITAISFDEEDQQHVPKEKLLVHLERALVNVVNKVGVDINRTIGDTYYRYLLPFVCGLGPRKAEALVHKITALGGNLTNRDQFIKAEILTTKLFLNASAFLRIPQDLENRLAKSRHADDDVPDPLDGTRIHPEDYELARKMATDALDLDDEDIHDEHPSHVIALIMQDSDREKKLNDLNLEDFADSLLEANNEKKRLILGLIRTELIRPFSEQRMPLPPLREWDVLTMLSGETRRTLEVGLMIDVLVLRTKGGFVTVRLDSGIEGIIKYEYVSDDGTMNLRKNQTVSAVVADVKCNLETDHFYVELSTRAMETGGGDTQFRQVYPEDGYVDTAARDRDLEMLARKKRTQVNAGRRVIKHPNFHNFNMAQAEAFLDKQQRGDVIIRPSSKGLQHLAVTWKVDDKLYQHLNVTDPTADPTTQTVGSQLIVDATHTYADLDELIVNHVQAINRKVEELMAHEKFKPGPEDELHLFLKNFVAANPSKSIYGFTLNRKKPGHFNLCFLANKNSSVQTWPIRVTPEAYYLFDAAAAGVPELCDAFKVRHLHESQNAANAMAGGKTPYSSRTPARPGHATPGHMSSRTPGHVSTRIPGHMSVRQPARTPNPYSGGASSYAAAPPPSFGGATPAPTSYNFAPPPPLPGVPPSFGGPPNPGYVPPPYGTSFPSQGQQYGAPPPFNGYQAPTQPPSAPPPSGMHPSRLQMLQGTGWQP
jgi:transcription elongation factor SPT6